MLIAGCVLGEMIDRIQVFTQVRDKGQRVGEGAEIVHPLQITGRDQGGKAIRCGAKRGRQVQEVPLEIVDEAATAAAPGKIPRRFLAEFLVASSSSIGLSA